MTGTHRTTSLAHCCRIPADNTGSTWTRLSDAPWNARQSGALVALPGGDLLLAGGTNGLSVLLDCWRSSDGGESWFSVTDSTMPPRHGFAFAVLPSGTVVISGGASDAAGSILLNDVWMSAAPNQGTSWRTVVSSAGWSVRSRHGMVSLPDGVLLLAGGIDTVSSLNDVWESTDDGASWALVAATSRWSARHSFAMVALPDEAVLIMGGSTAIAKRRQVWRSEDRGRTFALAAKWPNGLVGVAATTLGGAVYVVGGVYVGSFTNTVLRSVDGGFTWDVVDPTTWQGRGYHGVAALADSTLVLASGNSDAGVLNDVWVSHGARNTTIRDARCSTPLRAVCTAPVGVATVTVGIDAEAGSVSPPNGASDVVPAAFTPPLPSIIPVESPSREATLSFRVEWTSPVAGLDPEDFVVAPSPIGILSRSLQGSGRSYTLSLVLDSHAAAGSCPPGYRMSPGGDLCGRAVESLGSWQDHQEGCAPYTLAVVPSASAWAFLLSLRAWSMQDYWYVLLGWCCPRRR